MASERVRTALITGAAGGIGRALCSAFAAAGYQVIALDRELRDASAFGASVTPVTADLEAFVADPAELTLFAEEVRALLHGKGLNVLVNNAAVQVLGTTEQLTASDWETTLRTNVVAPFMLAQAFLPDLERARGSVVNMGSIHANLTKPGFVAYATSKSALVGMTRAMAVDLGDRVRVNAILPAAIATPMLLEGFAGRPDELKALGSMHPVGRIGEPSEVAALAVFLASDDAKFVSGAAWQVDGGIGARLHDPV